MKATILLCLAWHSATWGFGAERIDFRDQYDLDMGEVKGTATLSLSTNVLTIGQQYTATCLFADRGLGTTYYNPFFNSLSILSARLVMYNENKQAIVSFWEYTGGSMSYGSSIDWVDVPSGGLIGTQKEFKLWRDHPRIKPGICYLQLVYMYGFVTTPRPTGANPKMVTQIDCRELFRSNVVKVKIEAAER